ncbi:MAG: GNAT family N-acetyltransferase [Kiritimatiellae bacterium]|jgi:N-acetylglutamate synthase-like GNAT family acetyltransferase|nr:GNAT family N-acetyltransferase [Kiritimatiellia bacterium]
MKKKKQIVKIRPPGFSDAAAIYALLKEHPREVLPRSMSDIIQNIDRFLVAEINGRIAGTASWQILPEIARSPSHSVEIKSVAVSKDFQRHGVGTALVQAMIKHIRTYRPAQIVVLTFSPAYFRRFGFREVPKETLMHKLYMGCINCTKYASPFTCPEVAMTLTERQKAEGRIQKTEESD